MHIHPIDQRSWPEGGDRLSSGSFSIFYQTPTDLEQQSAWLLGAIVESASISYILLLIFPIVIQIWARFQVFHCNSNCNSTVPSFHHRHYESKWLEFTSNTYIHTWPHCLQKTTRAVLLQTMATNIDSFRGVPTEAGYRQLVCLDFH